MENRRHTYALIDIYYMRPIHGAQNIDNPIQKELEKPQRKEEARSSLTYAPRRVWSPE